MVKIVALFIASMLIACDSKNTGANSNNDVDMKISESVELRNLGNEKANSGDYQGAILDYNKAILSDPNCSKCYSNRGNAQRLLNDFQSAINDCNKAIDLDSTNSSAFLNRGVAKIESGNSTDGCSDIKKAIELGDQKALKILNRYCN